MIRAWSRTSRWRSMFTKLEFLPVPSQHIFSLMNFTVNNQDNSQKNSCVRSTDKRNNTIFANANLQRFKKSAFYPGIKITTSSYRSQKWNGTINITITKAIKYTPLSHGWLASLCNITAQLAVKQTNLLNSSHLSDSKNLLQIRKI